ncbi:unnamed protein product [Ostreobium quekettii]|uniref:Protein kinase domain-containing protein n=1 Tax=Ostreobium quekettii TaxID=121088 RepID=A0A8S1J2I2_9CHLO|nr:unnamed protein product [Ostreobium quekettii]|eukprot:evm.model.scf_2065.1 EVM.evm.TU.scf_2065.1   scf_2065:13060-17591(-)
MTSRLALFSRLGTLVASLAVLGSLWRVGGDATCADAGDLPGREFVQNARQMQAALTPRRAAQGLDLICVAGDEALESLSFLPRMSLEGDLTMCGVRRRTTLRVLEDFKMATVNGRLRICNLEMDLARVRAGRVGLDELLWDLGPSGSLVYSNVDVYVTEGPFGALRGALEAMGDANSTGGNFTLGSRRIDLRDVTVGRASFEEALVFLEEPFALEPAESDVVEAVVVNSTRDVSLFRKARKTQDVELRADIARDLGFSRCLLRAVSGSNSPIPVERPFTLASGGTERRLAFNKDLRRGFLDVQHQLRLDGVAVLNEAVYLELGKRDDRRAGCLLSEPGCFDRSVDEPGIEVLFHREMFKYDRDGAGCRLVGRHAVFVHGCDFVTGLARLLLYHRNTIQGDTALLRALNEAIQISDYETVGGDIRFRRFVGWGMCLENTTMTCTPPAGEKVADPRCVMFEDTDSTDPEVTTDLSESNYYKEIDSSGDEDGNNTSYYALTSSDFEDKNTSDEDPQTTNVTGVGLVVAGVVLWTITVALFCYWYKSSRRKNKFQNNADLAEVGALKKDGEEQDVERRWLSARSPSSQGESGTSSQEFIHSMKAKGPGDISATSLTRESLIGAISLASAGIEDSSARIQRQIAAGGSGVVYKGTWKNIPVAIKTVVFQDLADSSNKQRQRAIFEAAISSSVAHKNIVQTYAYSFKRLHASTMMGADFKDPKHVNIEPSSLSAGAVVDWKLYIVQEFCDGGSVRECLDGKKVLDKEDSRPKLSVMCQLAFEAASGMCHLHNQHNIVHGDLSSKNILLKKDPNDESDALGVAKIADFGLSIKMGLLQSHISNQRAGTPFYMAPELCHQGILSKKADVFSFGVFMWELYHSKKCYHMNAKTGMQYHPLFPKFPIMCPIPYAMLCVVCISPKPENRPEFEFIARVFAALKKQVDEGMFSNSEEVRLRNMGLAAGLGRMTAPKILELIAEQVGIPLVDTSAAASSSTRDESYSMLSGSIDISNSIKFPHSMFLPSTQMWGQGGDSVVDRSKSGDVEIHLSQAYVAPFNCVVTVSVSTQQDPDAPKAGAEAEHFDISWQCEPAEGHWGEGTSGENESGASANRVDAAASAASSLGRARGHSMELEMNRNPVSQDKSESGGLGPSSVVNSEARQGSVASKAGALNPTSEPSSHASPVASGGSGWSNSGGDESGRRMMLGSSGWNRISPGSRLTSVGGRSAGVRQERASPPASLIPMVHMLPSVQEEIEPASETSRGGTNSIAVNSVGTQDTDETIDVQSAFMPLAGASGDTSCEDAQYEDPHSSLLEGIVHSDSYPDGANRFPSVS